MPETPLGQIVSIRSENDKDILKNFSKEQNKIRNEWRKKFARKQSENMREEDYNKAMNNFKNMFLALSK